MDYLKELQNIIETTGSKHVSQAVKRNKNLYTWLLNNTPNDCSSISERIAIIQGNEYICKEGNRKKFRDGKFIFCGRPKNCPCALESVKEKVSLSKQNMSKSDVEKANKKREETNLKKYGVKHNSEIKEVVEKRKETHLKNHGYTSNLLNPEWIEKVQKDRQEKTGYKNPLQNPKIREKINETNKQKYGSENAMQNNKIVKKSRETKAKNYENDPLRTVRKTYHKLKSSLLENYDLILLNSESEYIGVASRPWFDFECNKCGHRWKKRFDYASFPRCHKCYPTEITYSSNEEKNLLSFIQNNYSDEIIHCDKSIINPFEIDILLPKLKLGIEYCGLYWHSENSSGKKWNYHKKKYDSMKNKGYDLITIFSDEWLEKTDVVKSILLHKLNTNTVKIYARKCKIQEISRSETKDFLKTNHIQSVPNKMPVRLGLSYNNQLVSVMIFIEKKEGVFELLRFCSSKQVVGGASKLFKHFVNKYNPNEIISFSDNRWFEGEIYKILNFKHVSNVPPMQNYVEAYQTRYHKLYFAKQKLIKEGYDSNLSEWEIMQSRGFDRIWDCGKKKWIWSR